MDEQKDTSAAAAPKGPGKALKFALLAFVVVSAGAVLYKAAIVPGKAPVAPAEAAPAVPGAAAPAAKPAPGSPAATAGSPVPAFAEKTAVIYYFYTNTRCSSCKAIEEYTKAAVEKNFASDYKGWRVVFKGVNVEEGPNAHFVQDYWLNSKSVVVQKFAGVKPLKWGKLEKVWQLLGDKEAFIAYITAETHKLLDEK